VTNLVVTEGIESLWVYHLSEETKPTKALCGKSTMSTAILLEAFGVGNAAPDAAPIKGRWCEVCRQRAVLMNR